MAKSGRSDDEREMPLQAQAEIARLRAELAAANQRIQQLSDFDPRGNSDPLLERIGLAKSRVGSAKLARWLRPIYRRVLRR